MKVLLCIIALIIVGMVLLPFVPGEKIQDKDNKVLFISYDRYYQDTVMHSMTRSEWNAQNMPKV